MSDTFGHLLRANRKDQRMGNNPITPEWPTSCAGDLLVLTVQTPGDTAVAFDGRPMTEVQPAWYWRLWYALTPWRVRTRVFVSQSVDSGQEVA